MNFNKLTRREAAQKVGKSLETIGRWVRGETEAGELPIEEIRGETYIDELQLAFFVIQQEKFALFQFSVFRDFIEKVGKKVEEFLEDDFGYIIGIAPHGATYAWTLFRYLSFQQKNVEFAILGPKERCDPNLFRDRKIIFVDGTTQTGRTARLLKEKFETKKQSLRFKEMKIVVYDDFAETPNIYAERRKPEDHLISIAEAIEKLNQDNA